MRTAFAVAVTSIGLAAAFPAAAWDGTITETGDQVEISPGNLVRPGREIEIFDWGAGQYRYVEVESITRYGGIVEIQVFDPEEGEYLTLEMEGR